MRLLASLGALVVLVGCGTSAQRDVALRVASADEYRLVQPILEVHCGTLDCHGDWGRALVIHGRTGLRLAPRADWCAPAPDAPCDPAATCGAPSPCLTDDEIEADVLSFAAVDPSASTVDAHLALRKALDDSGGGVDHVGGAVWDSRSAPGYLCLRSWLSGAIDRDACQAACDDDCDCQVARACGEQGLPGCLGELGIDFEDPVCH